MEVESEELMERSESGTSITSLESLPKELETKILDQLPLVDRLRGEVVCRSWESVLGSATNLVCAGVDRLTVTEDGIRTNADDIFGLVSRKSCRDFVGYLSERGATITSLEVAFMGRKAHFSAAVFTDMLSVLRECGQKLQTLSLRQLALRDAPEAAEDAPTQLLRAMIAEGQTELETLILGPFLSPFRVRLPSGEMDDPAKTVYPTECLTQFQRLRRLVGHVSC